MAVAAEMTHPDTYHALYDADFSWRHEQRQSFDPMASVRMFRYDLDTFGRILPETRERVQDEELSLIVEGMDRASRTTFALKRTGDDLAYFKNGQWASYTGMLLTGQDVAKAEARKDPRRQFLAEDAARDLYHLYQMRKLKPGQQHVWYSGYRKDIEDKYGAAFMRECGRFPDRQMGFLYRAYCNADGDVILESQTTDRSDDQAYEAAMLRAHEQGADMNGMVAAYDAVLAGKQGGNFYAGRRGAEVNENAWQAMHAHKDLIEYFLNKLEAIARMPLHAAALEEATKRHLYGTWAAFKQRIDGVVNRAMYQPSSGALSVAHVALLEREVNEAFTDFARAGKAMIGCGGNIEIAMGEKAFLDMDPKDVFKSIFGDEEADKFGSLTFKCTQGHTNKRPHGKKIKKCRVAGCPEGSVGC